MNLYPENGFVRGLAKGTTPVLLPLVTVMFIAVVCSGQRAELMTQSGHGSEVLSVAFSPNGRLMASASVDTTIKLWDVASAKELRTLPNAMSFTSVAFSPDGRTLAGGSTDKTIKLWEVMSGRELYTLQGHTQWIWSVSFSPDGQTLASGSRDTTIKLWEVATGKELRTLQGHKNSVRSVAFSPDGQMLASRSADYTIKLWSVATGKEVRTFRHSEAQLSTLHDYFLTSVVFSPDGQKLASANICQVSNARLECNESTIKLWDVTSGQEIRTLQGHTVGATSVAFSPDGQSLASGGGEGVIKLWDVRSGRELRTLQAQRCEVCPTHRVWVNSVAFSPDGKILSSGGMELGTIRLWNVASGEGIRTLQGERYGHEVTLSPDGKTLAESTSGMSGNSINLWIVGNETAVHTVKGRFGAFSPDGRMLATYGADFETSGIIKLLDAESGIELRTIPGANYTSVAFSPDGQTFATGSNDSLIKLWEVATGRELRTLRGHRDRVGTVGFSPDGLTLASGSADQTIKLWDIASGQELRTLEGQATWSNLVAFSPDGRILATGHTDTTIKLWDIASGRELYTLQGQRVVAFSPDGRTLASRSDDQTIKLWVVASGKELHTLQANTKGYISSISFSLDGTMLFVSSSEANPRLQLWDISSETQLCNLIAAEQNDWLVITPDGLFDGSPVAWNRILWRFSPSLYDVAPVEAFFSDFYRPGLLAEIFAGKRPHAAKDIAQKDRRLPSVTLALSDSESLRTASRTVSVRVTVSEPPTDKDHSTSGGAQDLRLFRNGSLVKVWRGNAFALTEKDGCKQQGAGKAVCEADIRIVAGDNRFTAYAFNHDNIKSEDAVLSVLGAESLKRSATAHILAIGINEYSNSQYNLRYASADARAFADELQKQQIKLKQFDNVKVISLLDKEATKTNILKTLKNVAGQAQPEDAVFIYFAGHGTAQGNRYYLVPHDLGYAGARTKLDQRGLDTILSHSISDRELEQAFEKLDVRTVTLVLDTCNSGQALESEEKRRGPMNSKGLAQLAYEKGMYILTAAESFQAAREAARLGHGYLTYALVEEGLKSAAADAGPKDGEVNLREWLDYATQRVPQMQREAMEQTRDLEHPLTFVAGEENIKDPLKRSLQTPRVFYRREPDTRPLIVAKP